MSRIVAFLILAILLSILFSVLFDRSLPRIIWKIEGQHVPLGHVLESEIKSSHRPFSLHESTIQEFFFFWNTTLVRCFGVANPAQASLAEEGVHGRDAFSFHDGTVGNVVLPVDGVDVREHGEWKFSRRFS